MATANDLAPLVEIDPATLDELKRNADRYQWLRARAVRVQGSDVWYSGAALDIRVDVGRDHVAEQAVSRASDPYPARRGK